jgi:hypothetical protein
MSAIERLSTSIATEFKDAWHASYYGDADGMPDGDADGMPDDATVAAHMSDGMFWTYALVTRLIKIIQ